MADGYDRFDNEGGGGGSFVMGLLTGTVLGAGLGMLFAPKAGSELRSQIGEQAGNIANTASDGYRRATEQAGQWADRSRDVAGQWAERGKDAYGQARDAVSRGVDEAQRYARDAAEAVGATPGASSSSGSPSSPSTGSGSSYGSSAESVRGSGSSSSSSGGSQPGGGSGSGGSRRS
jgi:gas vesicle protein